MEPAVVGACMVHVNRTVSGSHMHTHVSSGQIGLGLKFHSIIYEEKLLKCGLNLHASQHVPLPIK